ncbi:MAG: ATP synthase F0 subunit B [Deltaproteobacteria bacterium]|nr:ATP synthase F0 subunit B [Deltaproteobacteria bacterium]
MTELIITWQGLLFEAAAFLIFTYLLNLFLFRPLRAILKKREEIIGLNEDKQNNLEKLAEALNFEAGNERKNLRFEINEIKERFRKEAQTVANNLLSDAKINAAAKAGSAIEEFNEEKTAVLSSIKEKSEEVSILIFKKIIE